jgi:peptidoglycan/xylan/chitin deacetylase (PgdA/CDA1 family)
MTEGQRWEVLDELSMWAGAEPVGRLSHRLLTLDEVVALAQGDLVEIGGHTVTHPILSTLSVASQRQEILWNKAQLEEIVDRPVVSFAYPFGKQRDYTAETIEIVKEAGFTCACSSFAGIVERSTDSFELPRFEVQDWDGDELARQLTGWFSG